MEKTCRYHLSFPRLMTLQEQGYLKCLGMPRSQLLEDHRGGNALLCSVLMRQDGEHSERRVRKQEAHARIPSPNSFSFSICSVISTLQCLHTQLCNFGLASIQVFWVQPAYAASFFFFFFFLSQPSVLRDSIAKCGFIKLSHQNDLPYRAERDVARVLAGLKQRHRD